MDRPKWTTLSLHSDSENGCVAAAGQRTQVRSCRSAKTGQPKKGLRWLSYLNEIGSAATAGELKEVSPKVYGKEVSYRDTSLTRNTPPVGSYSSPMPRDLW